jgi:hypothetical protein
MKIPALLAIAMPLLLAGCSSPKFYWYHPDRSLDEAKADFTECLDQARRKAGDMLSDPHVEHLPPPNSSSTFRNEPLDQRPSDADASETQEAWRQRYEQSVISDCMREKGYMKVSSDHMPHGVHTKKFDEGAVAGQ